MHNGPTPLQIFNAALTNATGLVVIPKKKSPKLTFPANPDFGVNTGDGILVNARAHVAEMLGVKDRHIKLRLASRPNMRVCYTWSLKQAWETNSIDHQLHDLYRDVLATGVKKSDRTGTGTTSVFGREMRFNLQHGFPLVATKFCSIKNIAHELLWFLSGETNVRYLKEHNVNIWDAWVKPETAEYLPLTMEEIKERILQSYVKATEFKFVSLTFIENNELLNSIQWDIRSTGHEDSGLIEIHHTGLAALIDLYKYRLGKVPVKLVAGELGPVYGAQWRNWQTTELVKDDHVRVFGEALVKFKGIDQIQEVINALMTNPDSRRIIVSAWNPGVLEDQALPPCHSMFQFYTEELTVAERRNLYYIKEGKLLPSGDYTGAGIPTRKLSCKLLQRSGDAFLGLPYNIASYALLTAMIAQVVGMAVGDFIWSGGDCHIYDNHLEAVDEQLSRWYGHSDTTLKLNPAVTNIFDFKFEDITIEGYNPQPAIPAPVAV